MSNSGLRPSPEGEPCCGIFRGPATLVINPILALPEKQPIAWGTRWSNGPGCYQLKSALAWRELFEVTGESAFRMGYESALEAALANDREFLPGAQERSEMMDRLHAYSYFFEGLLPVLDRAECAAAVRDGLDRAGGYLREIAPGVRPIRCLRPGAPCSLVRRRARSRAAQPNGRRARSGKSGELSGPCARLRERFAESRRLFVRPQTWARHAATSIRSRPRFVPRRWRCGRIARRAAHWPHPKP